jgi:hypothetical protein
MAFKKGKQLVFLLCFFLSMASPLHAKSFIDDLVHFFSVGLSDDIFSSVNESIVGKLKAKNIRFFFPNKIEMDDIELLDENGDRVLYGKHAKLSISLFSLLTNNVIITDAYVDSPFFHYTIKNSVHNVIHVFDSANKSMVDSTKKSATKFRVTIAQIAIDNGSFEMRHDAGVEISARGVKTSGDFWVEKGPFGVKLGQVSIAEGAIAVAGMDLPLSKVDVSELFISHQRVSAGHLTGHYQDAYLEASGTVFIDGDYYDINAFIDAPEGTYPLGLKPLPFLMPKYSGRVSMQGSLSDPELNANVDFGSTNFNGLALKNGTARASISSHQVVIEGVRINTAGQAKILGDGLVDIDKNKILFKTQEINFNAKDLTKFLSLDIDCDGLINARTNLSANLNNINNLKINTYGDLLNAKIVDLVFAKKTDFNLSFDLDLNKYVKFTSIKIRDSLGSLIDGSGRVLFASTDYDFNYDLDLKSAHKYIPKLLPDIDIDSAASRGKIAWRNNKALVSGQLALVHATYQNFSVADLSCDFDLSPEKLRVTAVKANLFDGTASGDFLIDDFYGAKPSLGQLQIMGAEIASLNFKNMPLSLAGKVNADVKIKGFWPSLIFEFEAQAGSMRLDQLDVETSTVRGRLNAEALVIDEWVSLTRFGSLSAHDLYLNHKSGEIAGKADLLELSLSGLVAKYFSHLEGMVSGPLEISGTLKKPQILGNFRAHDLSLYGHRFGDGPLRVSLKEERLKDKKQSTDLVLSLSTTLLEEESSAWLRMAYAFNAATINMKASFERQNFDSQLLPFEKQSFALQGSFSGSLLASGPIDRLSLNSIITVDRFLVAEGRERLRASEDVKYFGPAIIETNIQNGDLRLELCASLDAPKSGECDQKNGLKLELLGPFRFNEFDLALSASLNHEHIEDLIFPLKNEFARVDAHLESKARLKKAKNQPLLYSGTTTVTQLTASLPNIPRIELKRPFTLNWNNNEIGFLDQAQFAFQRGDLTIFGKFGHELDLSLEGSIPLIIGRFIVPNIQRADGLAIGQLSLRGPALAPVLEGYLKPEKGSLIVFKKWLESIEIVGGTVVFTPLSNNGFVSKFEDIHLLVGDGKINIDGQIEKFYDNKEKPGYTSFDIQVVGSNIILRNANDFVEADFSLSTIRSSNKNIPTLTGNIIITDGFIQRQFDLRNFVLQIQKSDSSSDAFIKQIDMQTDLDIIVRQIHVSARMLNVDIDAYLGGQIDVKGPFSRPKTRGELVVNEGTINFPALSFELIESRIDLDELSDKVFDPKISIVTSQELSRTNFPQLSQDSTVELSLKGNWERLNLALRPTSGDMRQSQTSLFLLLLMPRAMQIGEDKSQLEALQIGARNAALAFSGEVFLRPLTNELQGLLESTTKTQIQLGSALEPGGVTLRLNWKIGPRIEMQGSYLFASENSLGVDSNKSPFFVASVPLGDLKLKLLLFDHKPLGPLSLETSIGAMRPVDGVNEAIGKIRLNYRVYSK